MISLLPQVRRFPNVTDWFDTTWPFSEHSPIRIEDSIDEDKYTVRAELPGFEPEKHIHVTADEGLLTIAAERETETRKADRSEFRYGSFSRTVSLPSGADTSKIDAKYTHGILEITVPIEKREAKKPVKIAVPKP